MVERAAEVLEREGQTGRTAARPGSPAPAGRSRSATDLARYILPPLIAAVVTIAAWETWIQLRDVPDYLVPAPSAVAQALIDNPWRFVRGARTSALEATGGLALGAGSAFLLGVAMAHSRPLERALYPLALLVKVTPVVAVAPLFIIWFGFGALPKVSIAALITFFPMLVNAVTGLRSVDPAAHDYLRVMHASAWRTFWVLRLPASLPFVLAALRISVPLALIGAVVAEWMAGDGGMGQVILIANSDFDTASLFAAVVVLAVIAVAMTACIAALERRVLSWHESAERT